MRIAIVNPPFPAPETARTQWITVPPAGYGGIQWFVAHLARGLAERGLEVVVLGAPESPPRPGVRFAEAARPVEIRSWLRSNSVDVIHDLSNDVACLRDVSRRPPYLSTHHFTGPPHFARNPVFVSYAQRDAAGVRNAPVIRIPVDPEAHVFESAKEQFALFLGRVCPWKGARQAAEWSAGADLPLVLAGPTWEREYSGAIAREYGSAVQLVGDVGGPERRRLLARAKVLLVPSQSVPGPWGHVWCEPGATVVGEAAVSGTPVLSSDNGCLPEIVPLVGTVLHERVTPTPAEAAAVIDGLPSPDHVRQAAIAAWHYSAVSQEYVRLYRRVAEGASW
jgi:glycosyltransferase involved in cell wall biosynthesis